MSNHDAPEGDCPPTNCSADEVFPLPWSYDCPRGKEATVYDADSRRVGFFSGADAQTRAAIITRAVNGYEKAMVLLREAADHIDTYDDGMAGWKDEAATILQNDRGHPPR